MVDEILRHTTFGWQILEADHPLVTGGLPLSRYLIKKPMRDEIHEKNFKAGARIHEWSPKLCLHFFDRKIHTTGFCIWRFDVFDVVSEMLDILIWFFLFRLQFYDFCYANTEM